MNRNLRLLGVGNGIRLLGNALYGPFLALFLHNVLRVGYLEIGVLFLLIGGIQLPFALVGGLATDRWGRRGMIVFGLASEALATLGLAYGFSTRSLLFAVVAATAGGIITTTAGPATSAYVADFAEGSERTLGFTWLRIGFNAGFAAGVALGGLLIATIDFAGAVLVASAILAIGAGFMALFLDPSPMDQELREIRRPSSLRSPRSSESPPATPTLTVAKTPDATPPSMRASLRILARDRVFLEFTVAFGLVLIVENQWGFALPLFVQNILGVPYALLGVGLALNGFVVVVGQTATTRSVLGRRHTSIAIVGLLLYVVAFALLALAGEWRAWPVVAFFVAVFILTIGENLVTIPQSTLPSNLAPEREVGAYNGGFQVVLIIGGLLSVVYGGWVLSITADSLTIWGLLLIPVVPAILLLRHVATRLPSAVDRA